jgi:alpha-tubulin suppressor-like RCC1 family protein
MAITTTNLLYAWGLGTSGQLGALTQSKSWNVISAGASNSLGITGDGRLYAWGFNSSGQLGDDTTINKSSPVQVGTSSWVAVSTGLNHTLAISNSNKLYGWGLASTGATGNYFPIYSWTMTTGTVDENIIALRSDNTLWAMGTNTNGTLGLGDTIKRSNFVQVGTSSYTYIGSGQYNVFAITTDYKLFGWGLNTSGQLGDDTLISKSSPIQLGVGSSWIAAMGGSTHSLFLKDDYTLWTSGSNQFGKLGLNDVVNRSSFTQVGTSSWKQITASVNTSAAIRSDDTLWTWGYNNSGQLGISSTIDRSSPTQITAPGTGPWLAISSSENYMLAITGPGLGTPYSVYAWGGNGDGATGRNTTIGNSQSPVLIKAGAAGASFTQISNNNTSNNANSMALSSDGKLWMWGYGASGELGNGAAISRSSPVLVTGSTSWSQIPKKIGQRLQNAIATDNTLYHWGISVTYFPTETPTTLSSPVQIGNNTIFNNFTSPYSFPVDDNSWTQIAAGLTHSVGIRKDNDYFGYAWVYAFGNNAFGQLGDNTTVNKLIPVIVRDNKTFNNVYANGDSSAAIATNFDKVLFVWGKNNVGQLGLGDVINRSSPTIVSSGGLSFNSVSVGYSHMLGITNTGSLYVWGLNSSSQLGLNDTINRSNPVQLGSNSWTQVSAGFDHSMGIRTDGTLWGWGNNALGQLGINTTINTSSPVQIGSNSWSQVTAGNQFTLAKDTSGNIYAWGQDTSGQLGF